MSDTATQAAEVDPELSAFRKARRTMWLKRLAIVLAVAALAWGAWYVLVARNYVSTDNAYVNARMAQVTPLVVGSAIEVLVEDTQQVKAGEVLVRLDQANAKIAVAQAEADLAAARRKFGQAVATNSALSAQIDTSSAGLVQARARLRTADAEFDKARIDLERREAVIASGAISGEELTQARKAYASANAALEAARGGISEVTSARRVAQGQLAANDALVRGSSVDTDPAVQAAKARLDAALLDLQRTEIRAPISGVVSRLQIQVGQRLSPGQTIMTIVPIDKLYVDANFKEDPRSGRPTLAFENHELDLHRVVGALFVQVPPPAGREEAVLLEGHPALARVEVAYRVREDSAVPRVMPGQIILGGTVLNPDQLDAMEGEMVAVTLEDGDSILKRIGAPLSSSMPYLRQFETIGGLGASVVLATERVDGAPDLPVMLNARLVLGVVYIA